MSGAPLVGSQVFVPSDIIQDPGVHAELLPTPVVATAADSSAGTESDALTEAAERELLEHVRVQNEETHERLTKMRSVVERERRELDHLQAAMEASKKHGLALQRELVKRQQVLAMLPQATENIAKLEVRAWMCVSRP